MLASLERTSCYCQLRSLESNSDLWCYGRSVVALRQNREGEGEVERFFIASTPLQAQLAVDFTDEGISAVV